ncbi:MAG: C40 family peptidase [Bacillota bacterium]|nr:C40 family peptidase [Bacillota bacterium]
MGGVATPAKGTTVFVRRSLVSLHRTPEPEAEVVTQARLGEVGGILETGGTGAEGWVCLAMSHDGYTGWTRTEGLAEGVWPAPGAPVVAVRQLFANVYAAPKVQAPLLLTVPLGTPLPELGAEGEWRRVGLPGNGEGFVQAGDVCRGAEAWAWESLPELRRSLVRVARQLLGLPYRWGGTTPWGLDCSGLVQLVYRLHGILLPRDACEQARDGRTVAVSRNDLQPGDLLFFADRSHVGLAVSHWEFIHATTHETPVVQVSAVDEAYWAGRRDEIRRLPLLPADRRRPEGTGGGTSA